MNLRPTATYLSRYLAAAVVLSATTTVAQAPPTTAVSPTTGPVRIHSADDADPALKRFVAQHTDAAGRHCALRATASYGALRYLACGPVGLWTCRVAADGNPTLSSVREVGGAANGFFTYDGRLWLEIASVHAQLLDLPSFGDAQIALVPAPSPPASAPNSAPPPPTAATPNPLAEPAAPQANAPLTAPPSAATSVPTAAKFVAARVLSSDGTVVNVAMNSAPFQVGESVAFYSRQGRDLGKRGDSARTQVVGRVIGTDANVARVQLGLNERVEIGGIVDHTKQTPSYSVFAPPRAAQLWEVAFMARPFIVIDNLGGGIFADARVGYHMREPFHVEGLIVPFSFGTAKGGATVPVAALVTGSYDTQLFEVGLGLGGQTVNSYDVSVDPGSGTTLAQRLRIGARDGAHLEAFSYVSLFHSRFSFSYLRVQAQIPVGRRSWLLASGSGGTLGLGHGEVGLRVLLSGNGGPDSFFFSTAIGGVNLFERCVFSDSGECGSIDYTGPMVGAGGEWRM